MAGAIAIAAALSRMIAIRCPSCGFRKLVERTPKAHRVCPKCRRQFPDPLATKPKRR